MAGFRVINGGGECGAPEYVDAFEVMTSDLPRLSAKLQALANENPTDVRQAARMELAWEQFVREFALTYLTYDS